MSLNTWKLRPRVLSVIDRDGSRAAELDVETAIESVVEAPTAISEVAELPPTPASPAATAADLQPEVETLRETVKRLEQSEQTYRHLVEDASEVFYRVETGASARMFIAGHCYEMTGRTPESFADAPEIWLEAIHPEDRQRVIDTTAHALAIGVGEVRSYRLWNTEQEAYRWVEDQITITHDESGAATGYQGVARDITNTRTVSSDTEALETQLLAMQKLEAIGELAGGVARDFGTQLTAMLTACQEARKIVGPNHPIADHLRRIADAGAHSTDLLHKLLSFSRRSTSTAVEVDVNAAISRTASLLALTLGPGIRLDLHLSSAPYLVLIDPSQLDQVIMNVALNAKDSMLAGGRLSIRTNALVLADGTECVRITVIDTGSGMDEETLAHAFDPLFTTKADVDGTGLGLSTASTIVQKRGGRIDILSRPGHGTTVKVTLPRLKR
jgi:signal transduction histidine kinase